MIIWNNLLLKNLTTMPVKTAAIIVPSLVPTKVKLKKISDSIIARVMQLMSNTIFILPTFTCLETRLIILTHLKSTEFKIVL